MSAKQAAGNHAATLVRDGMALGLGTGSTVAFFLDALALRIRAEDLVVKGVPTSEATAAKARELGIGLTDLEQTPELDLVVDGADEVDPEFCLIKGGGGALLREKIVARAARQVVIVVGEGKRVERLGTTFLLPVEILPFGHAVTRREVAAAGPCQPFLRTTEDGSPFLTDNGNYILDCKFPDGIERPRVLHAGLSQIPGVVEIGLFLDLCHVLVEGRPDGTARVLNKS
ncbi:MAG: ribose-5-phosphate isomerase RpiA [Planctomycetes bacterium]|nr:ribose-5-phosphate isomerase RpiA [Planctomycetota bacterium]MBL7009189.1 ribose-5-phosphate isomerase RpiA [Planctomycetota bacterium]